MNTFSKTLVATALMVATAVVHAIGAVQAASNSVNATLQAMPMKSMMASTAKIAPDMQIFSIQFMNFKLKRIMIICLF